MCMKEKKKPSPPYPPPSTQPYPTLCPVFHRLAHGIRFWAVGVRPPFALTHLFNGMVMVVAIVVVVLVNAVKVIGGVFACRLPGPLLLCNWPRL